ncbi:MAG: hypothetical protein EXS08_16640 [Planctomycetes bacterium]|nr:hypothetical protein [Planctomycetota bacterium]
MLRATLLLALAGFTACSAVPRAAPELEPARAFPAAWLGTWRGTVQAHDGGGARETFSMELTIAPTDDPTRFAWTIVYDGNAGRSERPYELVVRDAVHGRYAIDEGELELEARLLDDTLYTWFDVEGARLLVRERLEDAGTPAEALAFELLSSGDDATVISDADPSTSSHPPGNLQRARLRRAP